MIQSITESIKKYFYPTRYYREVTKQDETDFKEVTILVRNGTKKITAFYNKDTGELSLDKPKEKFYFDYGKFTFEKLWKTVFKGAAIGVIASGTPTLAGYCIIQVKYGALIGSAIGAIKVYADSTKGEIRKMYCFTDPKFLAELGISQENT